MVGGSPFLGCWERHLERRLEWIVRTYKFFISTYFHPASSSLDSGIWLADQPLGLEIADCSWGRLMGLVLVAQGSD